MDFHIGHSMSCPSVRSRREPSKIAQASFPQGFTLGYFRLFPPGRTALNASLFPHLELLPKQAQAFSQAPTPRIQQIALLSLFLRGISQSGFDGGLRPGGSGPRRQGRLDPRTRCWSGGNMPHRRLGDGWRRRLGTWRDRFCWRRRLGSGRGLRRLGQLRRLGWFGRGRWSCA